MTTPAICPLCRAAADPATGRCHCPPDRPVADSGSPDLIAKAEALFESYLAARVVHARRRTRDAKVAYLRDPRNREKAEALRQAEREASLLEMQLVEQTRKTQQARNAVHDAGRPPAPPAGVPPAEPASVPALAPSTGPAASRAESLERTCPRCAARAPGAVAECRCGYSFALAEPGAEPMFLSEDELLALRRGAK